MSTIYVKKVVRKLVCRKTRCKKYRRILQIMIILGLFSHSWFPINFDLSLNYDCFSV